MTEEEIMQRARRAVEEFCGNSNSFPAHERRAAEAIVAKALRDLDKPIVDPVLLKCREIGAQADPRSDITAANWREGAYDDGQFMQFVRAAYTAGKADAKEGV